MNAKSRIKNISSIALMILALFFVVAIVIGEWATGLIIGAIGALIWIIAR